MASADPEQPPSEPADPGLESDEEDLAAEPGHGWAGPDFDADFALGDGGDTRHFDDN